mgnify:CR=1 FL=1
MTLEAFIPSRNATVACGTCRLCCRKSIIPLLPEHGDDVASYHTQIINGHVALAMQPNGDCIYLGPDGCTIHGHHPAVCRTYDCAEHYLSLTGEQRREAIALGWISKAILDAGRERATVPNTGDE